MFKKLLVVFLVLALLFGGAAYYAWQQLQQFAAQPINRQDTAFFLLERGTNTQKLAQQLREQKIVENSELLPYLVRLDSSLSHFKAGVYSLEGVTTVRELLELFNSGKEMQLSVRLVEGRTFARWREQLQNAKFLNQTLQGKSEAEIAKLLDIPHAKLEGWFAPDTYSYVPYSDDIEILKRAYQRQQKNLDEAWQTRAKNLPLTNPYEMLILASIVEKETGIAAERPQVASVFVNRLNKKMRLQTDPTILYGKCGCYNEKIYKSDITKATPYNTYVIDGLPPTPIAMPGLAAIQAVALPDSTPYLYFVADGSGGHKFSQTLEEHNKAVREWRKIERSR